MHLQKHIKPELPTKNVFDRKNKYYLFYLYRHQNQESQENSTKASTVSCKKAQCVYIYISPSLKFRLPVSLISKKFCSTLSFHRHAFSRGTFCSHPTLLRIISVQALPPAKLSCRFPLFQSSFFYPVPFLLPFVHPLIPSHFIVPLPQLLLPFVLPFFFSNFSSYLSPLFGSVPPFLLSWRFSTKGKRGEGRSILIRSEASAAGK